MKISTKEPETKVPIDLLKALRTNRKVEALWQSLTPIARRDFISWVESAKQKETRSRRIVVACDKILSGKRRPCCYAIVPMNLYKALGANPKAKSFWSTLTPNERRDFVLWIESEKNSALRGLRIEKVCSMLVSGKHHP